MASTSLRLGEKGFKLFKGELVGFLRGKGLELVKAVK
jgi:hypothetical protein